MSLTTLVLGVFLILLGMTWIGWIALSPLVLGIVALIAGILVLADGYRPVTIWRRPQA